MQKQKLRLNELQVDSFVTTASSPIVTIKGGSEYASCHVGCTVGNCYTNYCQWPISGSDNNDPKPFDPSALCPSGYQQIVCG